MPGRDAISMRSHAFCLTAQWYKAARNGNYKDKTSLGWIDDWMCAYEDGQKNYPTYVQAW